MRFNRPHHFVDWKKHFKHDLIKRTDIDWEPIKNKKQNIGLKMIEEVKLESLKKLFQEYNQ